MKADLHFHSTKSDGIDTPEQVIKNLMDAEVDVAALSDHDVISRDFPQALREVGIMSVQASEISTSFTSEEKKIGIHMTAYANQFNEHVQNMVDRTLTGKTDKIQQQVAKLIKHGYEISYEEFVNWGTSKGFNQSTLSNPHLATFIYSKPQCRYLAQKDQQKGQPSQNGFHAECLKREGKNPIGAVEIAEYEPTLEEACKVVRNSGGLIFIAHPQYTWAKSGGLNGLERDIRQIVDQGATGIEINTLATQEEVKVILELGKKFGLLTSLGSDNHGEKTPTRKHGLLGQMNPYFLEDEGRVKHHLKLFRDRIGI